ncbi:MAG: hypothetical protein JST10_05520 [Bacteroidetes bacterium]|nr:hypothetical protein [Bacteroidota bacterium]
MLSSLLKFGVFVGEDANKRKKSFPCCSWRPRQLLTVAIVLANYQLPKDMFICISSFVLDKFFGLSLLKFGVFVGEDANKREDVVCWRGRQQKTGRCLLAGTPTKATKRNKKRIFD